jgi:hypothetical protein
MLPYAVVVPHWTLYVVNKPLGLIVPVTTALVVVMLLAAAALTVGGSAAVALASIVPGRSNRTNKRMNLKTPPRPVLKKNSAGRARAVLIIIPAPFCRNEKGQRGRAADRGKRRG